MGDIADAIGEGAGAEYRSVAETIKTAITSHWNGEYLTESTNRPDDGAVIHAITTFGEYLYPASSSEAAGTIQYLTKAFCREYPINQEYNANGEPGVLIGRYPGDSYAGGNPWQLLTAVLAEVFYLGGQTTYSRIQKQGDYSLNLGHNKEWISLLNLDEKATAKDLAAAQVAAGDAVMTSLWSHVQDADGRIENRLINIQ